MTSDSDRLTPAARSLVDLMNSVFPDLGGAVTDAAEARRIIDALESGRPAQAVEVGSVEDRVVPGPEGAPGIPVRIYRPVPGETPWPRPTVVYFHGGGWVIGSVDSYDTSVRRLCRASGATVVSVGYRLAPEHRFPAAAQDAYAALCWAAASIGELGGDPEALVVAGDSAGGNLATVACLVARERGGPVPALQVLVYPGTGGGQETDSYRRNGSGYFMDVTALRWFWEQYMGPEGDAAHPWAAPLRAADLSGMPPAYVVTAGCDPLCDEGQAYALRLREAQVPVVERHFPGMFHGFFAFPDLLDEAREALAGVTEAIAEAGRDRKNICDQGGRAG